MLSLCARRASRQGPHVIAVQTRNASSLIDIAPLQKRTLGFSQFARKVTKDRTWDLVSVFRDTDPNDPAIRDALRRHHISPSEWSQWSPVLYSSTFERALDLIRQNHAEEALGKTPSWVVLALACHKVKSSSDAEALVYDLTIPLTSIHRSVPAALQRYSPPLFVLTAHSLAHFALVSLLRPLSAHLLDIPANKILYKSFYFNMFLQAISNFPRSIEASRVAVSVLQEMQRRNLSLWADTERVLIRAEFVMPQLAAHLRRRGALHNDKGAERRKKHMLESWLRAYSSMGNVQESGQYLDAIRDYCLENGLPPPYPRDDSAMANDNDPTQVQGTPQASNTEFLRALRHDQQSAFRYFHHILKLDSSSREHPSDPSPTQTPSLTPTTRSSKTNVDIYDWTSTLHAGARDPSFSAASLLDLFQCVKRGPEAYAPTKATYTVVIQGLMRKGALKEAEEVWDEFVMNVVKAYEAKDANKIAMMKIDRYALCAGIDVLVQNGRAIEAFYLLDQAVKTEVEKAKAKTSPVDSTLEATSPSTSGSSTLIPMDFSYLTTHPIHVLFQALLNIRRPDVIFYIWAHLTTLYLVYPTSKMLRILLKAAIQASQIDAGSVKGAMSWYFADNKIFSKNGEPIAPTPTPDIGTPAVEPRESESGDDAATQSNNIKPTIAPASDGPQSRESVSKHLRSFFESPSPSVVGIWAGRRATAVARSIFRGMILGNWPALVEVSTQSTTQGRLNLWPELSRMFRSPTLALPNSPTPLGRERPKPANLNNPSDPLGPPLPTVQPTEQTFFAYISLLGLSSRAEEIPEVLVWMRALGIVPRTATLSLALVFWAEVGLRGPLFEDGWIGGMDWWRKTAPSGSASESGSDATGSESTEDAAAAAPRTEYASLRAWIQDWVGEQKSPTEADIQSAIESVAKMRDLEFMKRGGLERISREDGYGG